MADEILRIVTLRGGRPQPTFDFARGEGYMRARNTFAVVPAERETHQVPQGGRYGGSRPAGETITENSSITGTWYVEGATPDEALMRLGAILREAEQPGPGRYVEFRAPGATYSVFFERRGSIASTTNYKRSWFGGKAYVGFELSIPVSPLAHGLPLDIYDDFSDDTLEDYEFDVGSGGLDTSGGVLEPLNANVKRIYHAARGYLYGDVEATLSFVTGDAGGVNGPSIRRLGAQDQLLGLLHSGKLSIWKLDDNVLAELATTAYVPDTGEHYWVRLRAEGNLLTAELFGAEPTPLAAALATVTHTLAGANAAKFGIGAEGQVGAYIDPFGDDWIYHSFRAEPFTYKTDFPATIELGGEVPGDVDALVDVSISCADDPVWGMFAWGQPEGEDAPFGLVGGTIDTAALADADQFHPEEVVLEAWGRFQIGLNVIDARAVISAVPEGGGLPRYSAEFGSLGRTIVDPLGDAYRFSRLGTLTLPKGRWDLDAELITAPETTGTFELLSLFVVPAHSRSLGATGKPIDLSYPAMFHGAETKTIVSDGRGIADGVSDHGFGGALPRLTPGYGSFFLKLSAAVPDDPTISNDEDVETHEAVVHLGVIPRFLFAR